MPSNKTFVSIILCFGVVISVWLISKSTPTELSILSKNTPDSVSVSTYKNVNENFSDDWKKILNRVATSSETIINLTKSGEEYDDTTLTAQMAKDFMSQYLLLKKGGGELTSEEAQLIANNVLSLPNYTNTTGAVYINSNLNIINENDITTLRNYRDTINTILKKRSMQVSAGPVSILNTALNSDNPTVLKKLEGIIMAAKGMVSDLLLVSVPKDASRVHLSLLNATSAVLASLEAMGQSFVDPVRGAAGVSQYNQNMINFQNALTDMNTFFTLRVGSSI